MLITMNGRVAHTAEELATEDEADPYILVTSDCGLASGYVSDVRINQANPQFEYQPCRHCEKINSHRLF